MIIAAARLLTGDGGMAESRESGRGTGIFVGVGGTVGGLSLIHI